MKRKNVPFKVLPSCRALSFCPLFLIYKLYALIRHTRQIWKAGITALGRYTIIHYMFQPENKILDLLQLGSNSLDSVELTF
jgi:hypothetical protein